MAGTTEVLTPLSSEELRTMDAYWRACNYLSAGMIYLRANPLLREPLKTEHIKNRLLGHWGSDPGQSFVWVHMNRLIKKYDLNVMYISGPGHGAPATLANCYLEGYYSEIYPDKSRDEAGMLKFFRQFSFPGGIGSHCTPETPGSIHEGGELGYSIPHGYGAAFDNPDPIVTVMVGDGEAETGPLATSWHSNKFLNPIRDGAVLPVLHLNGYKIANPTILARISHEELEALLTGYGHKPYFVEGNEPSVVHQEMASTLEQCILEIREIQQHARSTGDTTRPRWPMIVLRSPKGWTGPKEVDGHKVDDFWRAHQVPVLDPATNKKSLKIVEDWMRSYKPEELFDSNGTLIPELQELAPSGTRRISANPHANGGLLRKENNQHLLHSPDREGLAVEQMLRMLPQVCPAWYDSIDLDADRHWALLKPTFREPEAEIDVILGRMASLADSSGAMKPVWPPSTDYLVAIEAKCLPRSWDDMKPWASAVSAKSNLTQQLKRDIELGFSCVSAMHVIATTPDTGSFGGAMHAASRIGNHFLLEAERQADEDVEGLAVGHCVLSVGEVSWKPCHQSGALLLLKLKTAPQTGFASPTIRDQVDSFLSKTPKPRYWRALYLRDRNGGWGQIDDLFAPLCSQS